MQALRHLLVFVGLVTLTCAVETNKETPNDDKITIRVHFTP